MNIRDHFRHEFNAFELMLLFGNEVMINNFINYLSDLQIYVHICSLYFKELILEKINSLKGSTKTNLLKYLFQINVKHTCLFCLNQ